MNTCSSTKKKTKKIESFDFRVKTALFSRFPFSVFLYYLQLTVHLVNQHVL